VTQRLHVVTLGVRDLGEARRFYVDGLGWEPTLDVPGEVVFIQVAPGILLSLWDAAQMEADYGGSPVGTGAAAVSLAHNVDSDEAVAAELERAQAAGARILKPAQRASWGGVHGHFEDPCGFRWEVAHNPGLVVGEDGTVHIGPG
jgi:catechol 2,3-dioxygenase-like lactoylglutathione lyase family enzyme